jgi:hypothetical protein
MKYYIDCEFDGHNGPLLSMALVAENGDNIHIQIDAAAKDDWVVANVLPVMKKHEALRDVSCLHIYDLGGEIRCFIARDKVPVIVADSPVDIARFCHALSTGASGEWASADYPLMTFEVHNVDCYPTDLPGAVQHNAWWDAKALQHRLSHP